MQINKKMLSIAVSALLILSIFAIAAPAFAITNAPTLETTSGVATSGGPVGSVVVVSGSSTATTPNNAAPFSTVTVYWNSLSGQVLNSTGANNDGDYSVEVTIPQAAAGTYYIVVNDGSGAIGAPYTVSPNLVASTTPSTVTSGAYEAKVLPGDSLTLTGTGFAAGTTAAPITVSVTLTSTTLTTTNTVTITTPTITTNSSGSFSAIITIPTSITTSEYDVYTVTATDSVTPTGNTASATILINYYAQATPSSGPGGITIAITGRIPASTAYTVTLTGGSISATQIASGTSSSTGLTSNTYIIPTLLATGAYTISINWVVTTAASASAGFTVTSPPTLTLNVYTGVAGATITATGLNFVPSANITLYFNSVVVNSTATDSRFGPTAGYAATTPGSFSAQFAVPALAPGVYTVKVVDQYGASATAITVFSIVAAPVTTISTASAYVQGDTISFTISTTDPVFLTSTPNGFSIAIKDPSGNYQWGTVNSAGVPNSLTWYAAPTASGTSGVVPIQTQVTSYGNPLVLPANAALGTWNWTIAYQPTGATSQLLATGLFTVTAGGVSGLNTQLNNMNAILLQINGTVATLQTSSGSSVTTTLNAINAKLDSIQGSVATLTTSMGTVTTSVNSLSSSIQSINSGVATIQTSVGTVTTSLSSLDAVLGQVANDTATLKTSVGDVTTSLNSIGTTVTSIQGNVATIQTDVGTLQGTVTSMSNGVATIQTGIGTLQTSVSNLQSNVSSAKSSTDNLTPLIIVAIVLALIAAIAAIASIVLMRRKIAG